MPLVPDVYPEPSSATVSVATTPAVVGLCASLKYISLPVSVFCTFTPSKYTEEPGETLQLKSPVFTTGDKFPSPSTINVKVISVKSSCQVVVIVDK